jgi:hypothetical protein
MSEFFFTKGFGNSAVAVAPTAPNPLANLVTGPGEVWRDLRPRHFNFSLSTPVRAVCAPLVALKAVRLQGAGTFQAESQFPVQPFSDGAIFVGLANGKVRMFRPEEFQKHFVLDEKDPATGLFKPVMNRYQICLITPRQ